MVGRISSGVLISVVSVYLGFIVMVMLNSDISDIMFCFVFEMKVDYMFCIVMVLFCICLIIVLGGFFWKKLLFSVMMWCSMLVCMVVDIVSDIEVIRL